MKTLSRPLLPQLHLNSILWMKNDWINTRQPGKTRFITFHHFARRAMSQMTNNLGISSGLNLKSRLRLRYWLPFRLLLSLPGHLPNISSSHFAGTLPGLLSSPWSSPFPPSSSCLKKILKLFLRPPHASPNPPGTGEGSLSIIDITSGNSPWFRFHFYLSCFYPFIFFFFPVLFLLFYYSCDSGLLP